MKCKKIEKLLVQNYNYLDTDKNHKQIWTDKQIKKLIKDVRDIVLYDVYSTTQPNEVDEGEEIQDINELNLINYQLCLRIKYLESLIKSNQETKKTIETVDNNIGWKDLNNRYIRRCAQLEQMGYKYYHYKEEYSKIGASMPDNLIRDSSVAAWNELIKFHKGERGDISDKEMKKLNKQN